MDSVLQQVLSDIRLSADRLFVATIGRLPVIAAAVAVVLVTWGLAALARALVTRWGRHANATRRNLLRHVAYYGVWAAGAFLALDVLGADAQAVVTGLGLGGLALGFALKDIISNFVSGLLILLTHAFDIGDQIVVGETEGTVERIELRATHIRTYDGRLVLVPNGEVFTSRVTNNTASPLRRASVFVYLDYRVDLDRAMAVILGAVAGVPGVSPDPLASMRLRDLTPQSLQVEARFWTDSTRRDFMRTSSSVRIAIVKALRQEGIELPRPDDRRVTLVEPGPRTVEIPPAGG